MHPVLTYLLLIGLAGLIVAGFWVERRPDGSRLAKFKKWSGLLQILALVGAYFVLRPGKGDDGRVVLKAAEQAGTPMLIDVYSNF